MLDESRRLELLAALGIDVYRLRRDDVDPSPPMPAAAAGFSAPSLVPANVPVRLVVACTLSVRDDARMAGRLRRVVRAIGIDDAAIAWVQADAGGSLTSFPSAEAYLMLGAAAARACAALLPIELQNSATIAVTAEPAQMLLDGQARRALWQALKPLARRLRGG